MSLRCVLFVLGISVGMTVLFWLPLWQGSGLVGGDLYAYFFPQKLFYAAELADGRIPLWNDQVAMGYPMLAESQTGVFYPPNLLLYRFLDVNTAYNVSQLGHYILAFVFTWLLLRKLALSATAASLGAIVFVYGWFPVRICLEWAIIGGVYFPLALLCVESFLQSERRRWLVLLALSQGIHLLAGHFTLAFITQLTCIAYAVLRTLMFDTRNRDQSSLSPEGERDVNEAAPMSGRSQRRRSNVAVTVAFIVSAIAVGFALAAVQLVPTWELRQNSQRENIGAHHEPGFGHIPPWYLTQIVAPWYWYRSGFNPDDTLSTVKTLANSAWTNRIEAHLYFGMVPLLLIVYRLILARRGDPLDRRSVIWLWLGLAAMIYSTGWLLPITGYLPGFSYFLGPGRYGIVTTLAAALLAGAGLDQFLTRWTISARRLLIGLVITLTIVDLHWANRRITYVKMVDDPPVQFVEASTVRRLLQDYESTHGPNSLVRLLAHNPNMATLTGFAAYPPYLGMAPANYFDPTMIMPGLEPEMTVEEYTRTVETRRQWLRNSAITHVLSFEPLDPLDESEWPGIRPVWEGEDKMLSRLDEFSEQTALYELTQARPRFTFDRAGTVTVQARSAAAATVTVETSTGGNLTWAELAYPGWVARISNDQGTTTIETDQGFFRTVPLPPGESTIVWTFEPRSVRVGAVISLLSLSILCLLGGFAVLKRRRNDS